MGCVLFELVTGGKKAFATDFEVHEYSASRTPITIPFKEYNGAWDITITRVINIMLNVNSDERPSTRALREEFNLYMIKSIGDKFKEKEDFQKTLIAYRTTRSEWRLVREDPFIWKMMGDVYAATDDYVNAASAYRFAIDLGFPHLSIYVDLGHILRVAGDFDAAIETFQSALKKDPLKAQLWTQLGDTYMSRLNHDAAIESYKTSIKTAANSSTFEKLGSAYLAQGNTDKAIKWYISGMKSNPSPSLFLALREARDERERRDSLLAPKKRWYHLRRPKSPSKGDDSSFSSSVASLDTDTAETDSQIEIRRFSRSSSTENIEATSDLDVGLCKLLSPSSSVDTETVPITSVVDRHSSAMITKNTQLVALWAYIPKEADELKFSAGDRVLVYSICEGGWATGIKLQQNILDIYIAPIGMTLEPSDNSLQSTPLLFPLVYFCHVQSWVKVNVL